MTSSSLAVSGSEAKSTHRNAHRRRIHTSAAATISSAGSCGPRTRTARPAIGDRRERRSAVREHGVSFGRLASTTGRPTAETCSGARSRRSSSSRTSEKKCSWRISMPPRDHSSPICLEQRRHPLSKKPRHSEGRRIASQHPSQRVTIEFRGTHQSPQPPPLRYHRPRHQHIDHPGLAQQIFELGTRHRHHVAGPVAASRGLGRSAAAAALEPPNTAGGPIRAGAAWGNRTSAPTLSECAHRFRCAGSLRPSATISRRSPRCRARLVQTFRYSSPRSASDRPASEIAGLHAAIPDSPAPDCTLPRRAELFPDSAIDSSYPFHKVSDSESIHASSLSHSSEWTTTAELHPAKRAALTAPSTSGVAPPLEHTSHTLRSVDSQPLGRDGARRD